MRRSFRSESPRGRSLARNGATQAFVLFAALAVADCGSPPVLERVRYSSPAEARTAAAARHARRWSIPRAQQPPKIDGQLGDACWQAKGAKLGAFHIGLSPVPARHTREAWAAYDADKLYFGVKLQREPDKPLRVLTHDPDNGKIWEDDEVEFFFDPFGTGTDYYQLILNSEGVLYDAAYHLRVAPDPTGAGPLDTKLERDTDMAWSSNAERKVAIGEKYWVIEMAVPLKSIGLAGAPAGHAVRLNLTSADWDTGEYTCLSPTSDWHDPQQFGAVVLGQPRVAVESLDLGSVGFGDNELRITVKDAIGKDARCRVEARVTTTAGTGEFAGKLTLAAGQSETAVVRFDVPARKGPWQVDVRIVDEAGAAVFAARRTGEVPPAVDMRLRSQAAFSDGLPVKLAARLGFGARTLREVELQVSLLDANSKALREQRLDSPTTANISAQLPVNGLAPGPYRLRLQARHRGRVIASAEDELLVGRSPFAEVK